MNAALQMLLVFLLVLPTASDVNVEQALSESADTVQTVIVDDADEAITYKGTWEAKVDFEGRTNNTTHECNEMGASAHFTFTGFAIELIAEKESWAGTADVYIDDELVESISFVADYQQLQQVVFSRDDLESGEHTIKIVKTGGQWIYVDEFHYQHN